MITVSIKMFNSVGRFASGKRSFNKQYPLKCNSLILLIINYKNAAQQSKCQVFDINQGIVANLKLFSASHEINLKKFNKN